ncbi:hypothetical protein M9458_021179, partial [Cirrhinus mrigala]
KLQLLLQLTTQGLVTSRLTFQSLATSRQIVQSLAIMGITADEGNRSGTGGV